MIPTVTAVRMSGAAHRSQLPLLVLGPSLGTSATTLWSACVRDLREHFDVLAWDLPGHGHNASAPSGPDGEGFDLAELAAGVLRVVDDVLAQRDAQAGGLGAEQGSRFAYAGDSVGGAVGLQLLLDAPGRVTSAVLLCTGAQIGDAASWSSRIEQVGASGTPDLVAGSTQRWFGTGFVERQPETASALLQALCDTADDGYAQVCAALASFDVRDRLGEIAAPVLAIAGSDDVATPTGSLAEIAGGVRDGRLVELPGVAHLAPAEAPERVAALIRQHVLGEAPEEPAVARSERYDAGMAVRREVLGEAHVDRASAGVTDLTRDFQELITEYAWGSVWTRPGLDRRSRSLITITAMVARGHHEELAMHLRAALTNGLSVEEMTECLMQCAIYCGVPDANAAFRIAQQVLDELPAVVEQ